MGRPKKKSPQHRTEGYINGVNPQINLGAPRGQANRFGCPSKPGVFLCKELTRGGAPKRRTVVLGTPYGEQVSR